MNEPLNSTRQLALGVGLNAARRFDNFVADGNESVLAALKATMHGESKGNIYLHGVAGSGKTHLLQACCALAGASGARVAYVPCREYMQMSESLLSDLHAAQFIFLDDVDRIAGQALWEQAVFRLYNDADAADIPMLFAGRTGPTTLQLADLVSRLSAALRLSLCIPDDRHRIAVMQQRAHDLGLRCPDEVFSYILSRQSRELGDLTDFLEALDRYALVTKRRITVALVREYLVSVSMAKNSANSI